MINLGIGKREFLNNFYEKNFYLHRSALPDTGITWDEINSSLYCMDLTESFIRLYKDGLVSEEKYTEHFIEVGVQRKRIIKPIFYEYMKNGATLVLNRIDSRSVKIKRLCLEISRFIEEQTIANGYLAFGGGGTFGNHWDTHDVVAMQLLGRKRWQVFKPSFPLPLPTQTSKNHKHECPTKPAFDGVLEAGDILYIPRGWWHNAIPMEGETFHIAVGIHAKHVTDYVSWICANILPQHYECRKSIHIGPDSYRNIVKALDTVKAALSDESNFSLFQKQMAARERVVSSFDIARLGQSTKAYIGPDVPVRINSSYMIARDADHITINGAQIKMDEMGLSILFAISELNQISMGELGEKTSISYGKLISVIHDLAFLDLIEILEQ